MFDLEYNHTSQKSDIVDIRYDLLLRRLIEFFFKKVPHGILIWHMK